MFDLTTIKFYSFQRHCHLYKLLFHLNSLILYYFLKPLKPVQLESLLMARYLNEPVLFHMACKFTGLFWSVIKWLPAVSRDRVFKARGMNDDTILMRMISNNIVGFEELAKLLTQDEMAELSKCLNRNLIPAPMAMTHEPVTLKK